MSPEKWIVKHMKQGCVIGCDPEQFTVARMKALRSALENHATVKYTVNLVDSVWDSRPSLSELSPWVVPEELCGESAQLKLGRLRAEMKRLGYSAFFVSALDHLMWLVNIRGHDSLESPVLYAYGLVTEDRCTLFVYDSSRVSHVVIRTLHEKGVEVKDEKDLSAELRKLRQAGAKFWVDGETVNVARAEESGAKEGDPVSPLGAWKATKNAAEQRGMRACHVKDAVALTRFLAWLEEEGVGVSEMDAAEMLRQLRAQESGFLSISFETILGSGAHGAIIHYSPESCHPSKIGSEDVVLVDSGGHYREGTTDVTRTIHMGSPTPHQRRCYTRVLQGHIDLARAIIAPTTRAGQLDLIARLPLFQDGLDYRHGTGHGVGCCLNVHEYPPLISSGTSAASMSCIVPGMIFSDEPGYYEKDVFGVRIESLLLCHTVDTLHRFHHNHYLAFENLTIVPFCRKMIDVSLLSREQVEYIDHFHTQCFEKLSPIMRERGDSRAYKYLRRETLPLSSSSSALRSHISSHPTKTVVLATGAFLAGGLLAYWMLHARKP